MLSSDDVEDVFRRLLPPEARVVAVAVAEAPGDWPLPRELAAARVVRQREFIAGRWCAARALSLLGVVGTVGRLDNRAPSWPMGATGSITHTRELAAAAVMRAGGGLGIDLEPELSPQALADVRKTAISDAEWNVLGSDPARATALFSAKETLFKCLHPRTGVWLDFTDAQLVRVEEGALVLRAMGADHTVRFELAGAHAFTALTAA